jgi:hypothetical protein
MRDTEPKSAPRSIAIRVARYFFSHSKSVIRASKHKDQRESRARKIYRKTKEEAWSRSIEAIGLVVLTFYTTFAGYQSCAMRRQTNILHWEEAAQVGLIDIEPSNFGSDAAEVIVTLHNSGQNAAKDFWFRAGSWTINSNGLEDPEVDASIADLSDARCANESRP